MTQQELLTEMLTALYTEATGNGFNDAAQAAMGVPKKN